ncbi:alcohol dehydrogenase [Akanthomyces lecanii RCEF 1005]|uniref:Alcohol dehydrogenase n=1 Tax=Akanthomyces lecanii RCEF 1005 TaxID=1081108 RepID=A0A168L1Z0_CORDF|nr:alcohol dehydrogenase [Akanthomyces lecanii RCEF 1005]
MAQVIPQTAKQWNVTAQDCKDGFNALKLSNVALPELGASQYRDLIIPLGKYPFATSDNVIPGSDGAGTVIAIGSQVSRFKPGDKVVTLFNQEHIGGPLTAAAAGSGLGGAIDGTLRSVGAFNEQGLVHQPAGLSAVEAATLPCAGLTAWNALHGLADNRVTAGQWVLTQGSGGVSVFALQFAKAAGARVIATTSSPGKAAALRALGADYVIDSKQNPDWGAEARKITGGVGVDHVVEVVGPRSMAQGLRAIRVGGVISIVGFVGGGDADDEPSFLDCLTNLCTARGLMVGSRAQMEDMCRAIEANPDALRPVVDKKRFKLEDVKEAYEYQWSGKHFGKVCVEIS